SVAAFFASEGARNAEAVVADRRYGAGDEIGMSLLVGAPAVTGDDWTAVAARRTATPTSAMQRTSGMCVATPTETGFRTHEALPVGVVLRGIGDSGASLGHAVVRDSTTIEAAAAIRDEARYLEALPTEEHVLVLVHRTEDIGKNLGSDTRKALRQALGALEED